MNVLVTDAIRSPKPVQCTLYTRRIIFFSNFDQNELLYTLDFKEK